MIKNNNETKPNNIKTNEQTNKSDSNNIKTERKKYFVASNEDYRGRSISTGGGVINKSCTKRTERCT